MNFMADSGNIFNTESPFPVQKAKTPPSAYMRATAPPIAFKPLTLGLGPTEVPPISGARVIKKTLRRSNGAVHVLETARKVCKMPGDVVYERPTPHLHPLCRLPGET